ncbi:hypothetical protein QOZ80_2BG0159030 [Eleusine coracana subsp. coracana]|nr:hypothetical protein QOZ80_2BG0159030 [Eleusine coracana subsp. coracana]
MARPATDKASVRVGSVPALLDGCILVRGEDSNKGHGPSCTRKVDGKVSVPVDQGVIRSLERPISTRFRLRRLLSFLESTRFYDAYVAMQSKVSVVLDLKYLQRYLELCLWDDARNYLLRILPYSRMGVDGRTLMDFLSYLMFMHAIATRHQMAPEFIAKFEHSCRDPAILRDGNQATIMRTILSMRSQQVTPSVNWSVVGKKAAEIVRDFITHAPEFSEYLRLPRRSSNIHNVINVLPSGFRSHGRIVKKAARVSGSVIAKYLLSKASLGVREGVVQDW